MPDLPIVKVDFDEAKELAHWAGVAKDLEFVMRAATKITEEMKKELRDSLLIEGFFAAALTTYVRCFTSGKRAGLTPDIFASLPGEAVRCHQQVKDTRDKHISHSVNPFEEMLVGVVMEQNRHGEWEPIGIARLTAKLIAFDIEGVEQLRRLAHHAHNEVTRRIHTLEQSVLAIAKSTKSDDLMKSERLGFTSVGADPMAAATPRC